MAAATAAAAAPVPAPAPAASDQKSTKTPRHVMPDPPSKWLRPVYTAGNHHDTQEWASPWAANGDALTPLERTTMTQQFSQALLGSHSASLPFLDWPPGLVPIIIGYLVAPRETLREQDASEAIATLIRGEPLIDMVVTLPVEMHPDHITQAVAYARLHPRSLVSSSSPSSLSSTSTTPPPPPPPTIESLGLTVDDWPYDRFELRRVIFLRSFKLYMIVFPRAHVIMDHVYCDGPLVLSSCNTNQGLTLTHSRIHGPCEIAMGGHNHAADVAKGIAASYVTFDQVEFGEHASFFDQIWRGPVRFTSCHFHAGTDLDHRTAMITAEDLTYEDCSGDMEVAAP